MRQKINWITYLLIGVTSICLFSCKKVDSEWKTTYVYSNRSNYAINLLVYNESRIFIREFRIPIADSITIVFYSDGSPVPPFHSMETVDYIGDSISVTFNDLKYVSYVRGVNSSQNIFDYRNYEEKKLGKNNVQFSFIFTNEHYENSVPLN